MKQTQLIMGMPVTVEIADEAVTQPALDIAFNHFKAIDRRFSTYKPGSEISRVNRGLLEQEWSTEMRVVLHLCEQTKQETNGYFDIRHHGQFDPSGLVKGWAIQGATNLLRGDGWQNFYVDAGGDIQTQGLNQTGQPWRVGIRHPLHRDQIVKVLAVSNGAVATSGTYIRGQHVYNPHHPDAAIDEILSLTVVGEDICDADRFATAAFAMGRAGINFVENLNGFEGYLIDSNGHATLTSGFESFLAYV